MSFVYGNKVRIAWDCAVEAQKQLDLLIFKVIVNYDLKVLKENWIVQSIHVVTTKFDWGFFDIYQKGRQKKKKGKTASTATSHNKNIKRIHYCLFSNEL